MRNIFLFTMLSFLAACTSRGKDCDYYEPTNVMMEVVEINSSGTDSYDVMLRINRTELGTELQSLGKLRDVDIDQAFLTNNKIEIGNVYMGTVTELKSGNCKPYYVSFDFKFQQ